MNMLYVFPNDDYDDDFWETDSSHTFPTDAFPGKYAEAIREISEAFSTPEQVAGVTLLSLAGACAGRTVAISPKAGWHEHPNLWVALVGRMGAGKSPPMIFILDIVQKLEEARELGEQNRLVSHLLAELPEWTQVIVDDITPQALADSLVSNPRGVLWYRDELTGILLELKRNAVVKARLNTAYNSGPWRVTRVNEKRSRRIPHATVALLGSIQPEFLHRTFSQADIFSGFMSRFLFSFVPKDSPAEWTEKTVSQATRVDLGTLFSSLLRMDFNPQGDPHVIEIAGPAKYRFISWFNDMARRTWSEEEKITELLMSKLTGQCLRVCLCLHLMEWAANPELDFFDVKVKTVENAIMLIEYFLAAGLKAHRRITTAESRTELRWSHRRVIECILDLIPQISGGVLPTHLVAEKFNEGLEPNFRLSVRSIGRILLSLDLKVRQHVPGKPYRGVAITPDDIERLRSML